MPSPAVVIGESGSSPLPRRLMAPEEATEGRSSADALPARAADAVRRACVQGFRKTLQQLLLLLAAHAVSCTVPIGVVTSMQQWSSVAPAAVCALGCPGRLLPTRWRGPRRHGDRMASDLHVHSWGQHQLQRKPQVKWQHGANLHKPWCTGSLCRSAESVWGNHTWRSMKRPAFAHMDGFAQEALRT